MDAAQTHPPTPTDNEAAEPGALRVVFYNTEVLEERTASAIEECAKLSARPGITWVDVAGANDPATVEALGAAFDLHPLLVEDVQNTRHRAKLDDLGHYMVFVVALLVRPSENEPLQRHMISLVLGQDYVLTFTHGLGAVLEPFRERLRAGRGRIRSLGADYLAHALVDTVVDGYYDVLEGVSDRLDGIEEELLTSPDPTDLPALYNVRQDLLTLRHAIWPMRDAVGSLERRDSPLIAQSTAIYFRDVYDHLAQLLDTVETQREMASGLFDLYLSSISNRLNEIMKVLTIISTLFMPLTFLAGIYGMNFQHMPELGWRWGYPMVWAIALVLVVAMLWLFRRRNWL
ncbi:MAG: magnesium/cobalt transporter CorA [Anaerolineae bacterium]